MEEMKFYQAKQPRQMPVQEIQPQQTQQQQQIAQKVSEFTRHIENKIWETPITSKNPPYIQSMFAYWRKQSYQALQNYISKMDFETQQQYRIQFHNQVNKRYINDFTLKLKQPYFDKVYFENYAVPEGVDIHKIKKDKSELSMEMQRLAYQISEWCIQIELSTDLIERAELMDLYDGKKNDIQIYEDLKDQLEAKKSMQTAMKGYAHKALTYGMKMVSSMLWDKGVSQNNLTYGSILLLYYTFLGTGSIPLQMILPNSKLAMIAGGIVGSYALGVVADQIDQQQFYCEISELKRVFKDITQNLLDFNTKCQMAIGDCLKASDEKDLEKQKYLLSEYFKQLLEQTQKFKQQRDGMLQVREIVETEIDDNWTLLESKEEQSTRQELEQLQKQ